MLEGDTTVDQRGLAPFPTVHDLAGGTGTYADPITYASDKSELPIGTVVYAPVIEKYLVMVACEDQWTQNATTIEIDPPPGRTVTTAPLFVPSTNTCRTTP